MTTILLTLASLATPHHATPLPPVKALATWTECVSFSGCSWHEMPKAARRPTGHWTHCKDASGLTICVQYPRFHVQTPHNAPKPHLQPMARAVRPRVATGGRSYAPCQGPLRCYQITGYSWGCGTPNPLMASMQRPYVGAVSNDWLPFGTRIYVPSLGYAGTVEDRGVGTGGFDLFMPSCLDALTVTGWREVVIG